MNTTPLTWRPGSVACAVTELGAAPVAPERGSMSAGEPRAGALAPTGYPASFQALRIAAVAKAGAMPAFSCSMYVT